VCVCLHMDSFTHFGSFRDSIVQDIIQSYHFSSTRERKYVFRPHPKKDKGKLDFRTFFWYSISLPKKDLLPNILNRGLSTLKVTFRMKCQRPSLMNHDGCFLTLQPNFHPDHAFLPIQEPEWLVDLCMDEDTDNDTEPSASCFITNTATDTTTLLECSVLYSMTLIDDSVYIDTYSIIGNADDDDNFVFCDPEPLFRQGLHIHVGDLNVDQLHENWYELLIRGMKRFLTCYYPLLTRFCATYLVSDVFILISHYFFSKMLSQFDPYAFSLEFSFTD